MDRQIPIEVAGYRIRRGTETFGAVGTGNAVVLRLRFDEAWDGLAKTAKFTDARGDGGVTTEAELLTRNPDGSYSVAVPREAMAYEGAAELTLIGELTENGVVTKRLTTKPLTFRVDASGADRAAQNTEPITATDKQQILAKVNVAEAYAKGTVDGIPVTEGETGWHDNAAYYRLLAETAQENAEAAQTAAETAQTAAETAQGRTEDAQESAEAAQSAAETAQGKAEAAQTAAESAQGKAEAAQTAAETAQGKAEAAQTAAETAQTAAETAQGKAEDAQEATEAMMKTVVASDYSASATYSKGDYVLHEGALYRAKQDIETAEVWTASHWESVSVSEALQQLQTAISAPETYAQLQALVRSGLAHLSVKAGDQVIGKVGGTDYAFDVLGVDEDCPVDTPTKHVLSLQMHDIWTSARWYYSYPQLLYAVTSEKFPSGMGPGIYTFKLDHAVSKTAYATAEDGYYSFVIPQGYSVPIGGGIRHTIMGSEASGNAYSPSRILGGKFICYGADRVTAVSGLNALSTVAPLDFEEGSTLTGEINADTFYAKVGASGGKLDFYYFAYQSEGHWESESGATVDLTEYGITITGQPADGEKITVTLGKMLGTTTAKVKQYISEDEPINFTTKQILGDEKWSTSFARQYLNSDASPMVFDYAQAGLFGRPPSTLPSAGFLYALDPDLKAVLCKTTKRYAKSVADGYGYEDVTDKVGICTRLDLGLGANKGVYEGAVSGNALKRQSAYTLWENTQQADRIKFYGGTAKGWDTSSCTANSAALLNMITASGSESQAASYSAYGWVPCMDMIIKEMKTRILELTRENGRLRAQLENEREKLQFLGLLAADVDLDELTEEDDE